MTQVKITEDGDSKTEKSLEIATDRISVLQLALELCAASGSAPIDMSIVPKRAEFPVYTSGKSRDFLRFSQLPIFTRKAFEAYMKIFTPAHRLSNATEDFAFMDDWRQFLTA